MAALFSQLFIILPPLTDCENLNHPLLSVDPVDDINSLYPVFRQPETAVWCERTWRNHVIGTRPLPRIHFVVLGLDNFLKNPSLSSSSITLSSRNCPRLISPFTSTPWRTSSRALLMPPRSTRGGKENFGP